MPAARKIKSKPGITPKPAIASTTKPRPPIMHAPGALAPVKYNDLLLTRLQTARWLGVTVDCLSTWARQGRGPRVLRVGQHKTAYQVREILRWLNSQTDAPKIPCKRRRQWTAKQQKTT